MVKSIVRLLLGNMCVWVVVGGGDTCFDQNVENINFCSEKISQTGDIVSRDKVACTCMKFIL